MQEEYKDNQLHCEFVPENATKRVQQEIGMTMWLEKFIRICHESLGLNEMSDSITPLFETCGDDNFCENLMCEQTKEKT